MLINRNQEDTSPSAQKAVKILRVLRVLRPLKAINKAKKLKVKINYLLHSIVLTKRC